MSASPSASKAASPALVNKPWPVIFKDLSASLKPIIALTSGGVMAYESLIRGFEGYGFDSPLDLFDAAFADGVLPELEAAAWKASIGHFAAMTKGNHATESTGLRPHLSLNIDNRSLAYADRLLPPLLAALQEHNVAPSVLILDIGARWPLYGDAVAMQGLEALRGVFAAVALDDFGMGWSGMPLLYVIRPDYIKVDPFYVRDATRDGKRRLFLPPVVNLAHMMTIKVVAKGIDTESDYLFCRDAGCDFGQGWFVGDAVALLSSVNTPSRRMGTTDIALVKAETDSTVAAMPVTASLPEVFERFRREQSITFLPVVDDHHVPLGVLREHTLKGYAYSPYGKELLANRNYDRNLGTFLSPCPVADIKAPVDQILGMFSAVSNSDGVLMTDGGRYVGFLSAAALLRIINEKNVATARDQNPLSRLPGNRVINDYLAHLMAEGGAPSVIAYLDFDNFKPFNDTYGFRQGDRAITLFAGLLSRDLPKDGVFVGHIGGDDFFVGFYDMELPTATAYIHHLIDRFTNEVESFYNDTDRAQKSMRGVDRDGAVKIFPLLSCSAALVGLSGIPGVATPDDLSEITAVLKKRAKGAPSRIASTSLGVAPHGSAL